MNDKHTPGPWTVFIDDSGDEWTGWPLSINAPSVHEDCMVVRTGGQWPYEWDYRVSRAEAVANANLIAAAPDLLELAVLFKDSVHWEMRKRENTGDNEGMKLLGITLARIDAAIAKAEGRA